jgi:hypothetical protein
MAQSKITLVHGEIAVSQGDLTLLGPSEGAVAISGNHATRVINHSGGGTLTISGLTIEDGTYNSAGGDGSGGCIKSAGSVVLLSSTVSNCALSSSGVSKGGGIYVHGDLSLMASTLSHNYADSTALHTFGGGAYVYGNLGMKYSTADANTAHAAPGAAGHYANGGGISVRKDAVITASTISRNVALQEGAIDGDKGTIEITDSTIAENVGTRGVSGIWSRGPVAINNSTIAFNRSYGADNAALAVGGSTFALESSVIANNSDSVGLFDIYGFNGVTATGANNLVTSSKLILPADTITSDPQLGPLRFNGGMTETLALALDSPALGKGNNLANQSFDQRGVGYPRTTGAIPSVDIGSLQSETIFVDGFE